MSSAVSTALDLVIRASLLLGVGLLAGIALHRASAAVRHLVFAATLGGSLVMAALVPWAPRVELPLSWWRKVETPSLTSSVAASPEATAPSSILPTPGTPAVTETVTNTTHVLLPLWLIAWASGAALVLGWTAWGRLGLARIRRRAVRITNGPWPDAAGSAATSLNVRRPIELFTSRDVGAPMTWGASRPVLILPADSVRWNDDLRRSVAAHEVAHMARQDYLLQLMATFACAVYWFHPLAWMIAHRMRLAAEKACDDQVLSLGTSGEDYAQHLIGIARNSRSLRLTGAVAIGMARATTLEGRIMAVLDSTRLRNTPTSRGHVVTAMATVVALFLLGGIRPVPADARVVDGANVVTVVPSADSMTPEPAVPVIATPTPSAKQGEERRQGQHQSMEDIVNANPGEELVLDLSGPGGHVVVRGWDESRVRVRTSLGGPSWRDVEVKVERESGGVRVRSRFVVRSDYQSTDIRYEINVPRRFDVRLSSGGGGLTLVDIEGRFSGNTGGGSLVFERLKGSSSLSTGGGEIRVSDSELSGRVSTGGGSVVLSNVRGGLRGSSGSGPVVYGEGSGSGTADLSSVRVDGERITISKETTYRSGTLSIDKAGGDVILNEAPNGARIHTGGGDIRVGRSAGTVRASTGGGDVRVGPVAGSIDAGTGAGEIHLIVDKASGEQVIEASSGYGRVIIELPSDFDGRLNLETAHTRTHESTSRIESDWDLNREPLTDWENRYGTPRRFLRATGVLGRGTGSVTVRTVNGEIEIRRRQ